MGLGSGIRDPKSGIRKKPIPDPGVKKAPDPGSGSATLYTYANTNLEAGNAEADGLAGLKDGGEAGAALAEAGGAAAPLAGGGRGEGGQRAGRVQQQVGRHQV
jgi:hypothetical protein